MNFKCGLITYDWKRFSPWEQTTGGLREKKHTQLCSDRPVTCDLGETDCPVMSILEAARDGNTGMVKTLLHSGISPNTLNEEGLTPLLLATIGRYVDLVQLLIGFGADLDYSSSEFGTALHIACFNGYLPIVRSLLKGGADSSISGPSNQTCLFLAAQRGHIKIMNVLLHTGIKLDIGNDIGLTALHGSVMGNWTYTALYLIRCGANVNKHDCKGNLPLHYAVREKNGTVIKALIKAGCYRDHMNSSSESPLHVAVRVGHVPTIKLLVKMGCNVNVCKAEGNGLLHTLVSKYSSTYPSDFQSVLEILLFGGCNIDVQAFNTLETPLYQAISLQKQDVAEILLAYGANPNLSSPFDITALQLATRNKYLQTVLLMLHCGINWKRERWLNHVSFSDCAESQIYAEIFNQWKNKMISLQNLCRITVRQHQKSNLFMYLNSLRHFPGSVRNFMMLADLSKKQYYGEPGRASWLFEDADETYGPTSRRKNDKEDICVMEYDHSV